MGTTIKQDRDFITAMIDGELLEQAIEWITETMKPEEIYEKNVLENWATENGFIFKD